jgi:DNA repair protein RecO (recombination protein O)
MSIEKSEAVLLKAFNWSESSRTVIFFSSDFGRIALVDKGGRSMKSRRGRIVPFARMEIGFYHSQKETRGYVREVELVEAFSFEENGSLGRLAYASAASELLNLLLPEEEPQRELYDYYIAFLSLTAKTDRQALPPVFVAFYLRVLSQLGYHPSLAYCVGCGKEIGRFASGKKRMFGIDRGGVVCEACQKPGEYYIGFSDDSFQRLLTLQTSSLAEAAAVKVGFKETTLFLDALTKFLAGQTGFNSDLKSLRFIEKLKNSQLIG